MSHTYFQIGAHYLSQYHPDPRKDAWRGTGWTEWELLGKTRPRFPGHQQPKAPLWGYYDG